MLEKPYLSIDEQIATLKSQGLVFNDEKKAKSILKTHSYYSIVNQYCDLLVNHKSPRLFKSGATFEELLAIHDFDTSFRRFLFPQILYIEEKIKAILICEFSGEKDSAGSLLHSGDDYLCLDSFELFNVQKRKAATKLVIDLTKATENNKAKDPIKYQIQRYGYVPFWTMASQMTFGQTSRFYECCHFPVRDAISKAYKLSESELRTILKIMNVIRNCCAHNNRVFCVNIPEMLPSTLGHEPHDIAVDPACHHKFGSILYCLKFLLSSRKFRKIITELTSELRLLKNSLHTIPLTTVLKKMGISTNMIRFFDINA